MKKNRINEQIRAEKVLVIDEKSQSLGTMTKDKALSLAKKKELDLAEVAPQASPPVCRIMDWNKKLYEQEKQAKKNKARQKSKDLKEIRLSIRISDHDLEIKKNRAKAFLKKGHKLKISIKLLGREGKFSQKAYDMIRGFSQDVGGRLSEEPKKERNIIFALVDPS